MRKSVKIIMLSLCAFIILLVVAVFISANYVFTFILDTSEKNDLFKDVEPEEAQKLGVIELSPNEQWLKDNSHDVYMQSHDNLKLHGFYIPAKISTDKYVIIVHGYKSSAWAMSLCAQHYSDIGFNVLVIEQRAHGSSEGRYIGMGWPEHFDVINWIEFLIQKNEKAQIVLHGFSMGAATVMLASGEKALPKNVYAIIEDCGYTSINEQFKHQIKQDFGFPVFPLLNITSLISKFRADYFFGYGNCKKAVSRASVPMLFIHGDKDDFVPFRMMQELFHVAGSANAEEIEKEMLVVKGAEHSNSIKVNPQLYWATIEKFLEKYSVQRSER